MVDEAAEILTFWFEDIEHSRWFLADPEFDRQLSQRFRERLRQAKRGELDTWAETARGRLALILVLDQFSRNIHRGERQAFEADAPRSAPSPIYHCATRKTSRCSSSDSKRPAC
jgi:uncharacterized protein (DUF924 family)